MSSPHPHDGLTTRSPLIDVLRGLAILSVILLHIEVRIPFAKSDFAAHVPRNINRVVFHSGFFGVRVFFVISGFLITRTILHRWRRLDRVNITQFYQLRLARIAPCLLGLIAVMCLLHYANVTGFMVAKTSLASAVFAALTFHINALEIAIGYLPATWDVLWSLSIEEAFYLAYPPLSRFLKAPMLLAVALALIIAGPLARTVWAASDLASDYSYLSGFDSIALGCFAGYAADRWRLRGRTRKALAGAGVALMLLVLVFRGTAYALLHLGTLGLDVTTLSLGTAFVLWSDTGAIPPQVCSWLAPLRWMGRCSYEIYLTHSFVTVIGGRMFQAVGLPYRTVPLWDVGLAWLSAVLGALVAVWFSEPINQYLRPRFSASHASESSRSAFERS